MDIGKCANRMNAIFFGNFRNVCFNSIRQIASVRIGHTVVFLHMLKSYILNLFLYFF